MSKKAPAETDNTLGYYYFVGSPRQRGGDEDYEFFEGFLFSDTPKCENAREVTIYRARKGDDERIATVETVEGGDGTARYFYIFPDDTRFAPEAAPGKYYSKPAKVSGCEAPESDRVRVGPGPAEVTISLRYVFAPDDNPDREFFVGALNTSDSACGSDRKVTLYRKEKGKDERVGTDRARGVFDDTYQFDFSFADKRKDKPDAPRGSYYAVPEKVAGCQGPKSETVRVARRQERSSAGVTPAKAKLEIESYEYEESGSIYEREMLNGRLSSDDAECEDPRSIELFRKRSGKDELIDAQVRFEYSGNRWFAEIGEELPGARELVNGLYYAQVPDEVAEGTPCAAAKSKPFEVKTPKTVVSLFHVYFMTQEDVFVERFEGEIDGAEADCRAGRKITLYRRESGRDPKVGTTRTGTGGDTLIGEYRFVPEDLRPSQGYLPPGTYYAKVSKADGCDARNSQKAKVEPFSTSNQMDFFYFFGRRGDTGGQEREFFEGYIGSFAPRCHQKRMVTIFRKLPGKDEEIATVQTVPLDVDLSRYFYIVPNETPNQAETESGTYYSVTDKREGCKTATSEEVTVSQ